MNDPNVQYAQDQRGQYGSATGQNGPGAEYNVSVFSSEDKILTDIYLLIDWIIKQILLSDDLTTGCFWCNVIGIFCQVIWIKFI